MSDHFQMFLPSNVKSSLREKRYRYVTELATPLDLLSEWNVDLIDILYQHNWTNLDKSYQFFLLRQPILKC